MKGHYTIDHHLNPARLPLPYALMPSIFSWKECARWIPIKLQKLPFDMFVLDDKYMPEIAFLSSPLAGQSSGRDPGAPVATGNWGRATCEKKTWIPCPPLDWSKLKNLQKGDVPWQKQCPGMPWVMSQSATQKRVLRELTSYVP